jgi:YD repeat-containing protein
MPACRAYATATTFTSSLGASYTSTCSHSESASGFARSCTTSGITTVEHWANKGTFIDEAAAIGITKLLRTSNAAGEGTYQYDAQGRLTSYSAAGSLYATYDAWDSLGRVTHLVLAGSCAGSTGAVTYNDAARSITSAVGGTCSSRSTVVYDANIIPISIDYGDGTTGTYTATARANVCR